MMCIFIGLSLAKRINQAGVFIRNIVPGSAVDQSNLKVGDQILMLNGESIIDENPTDIVERLRLIAGTFELVVKRTELN
jgi:C-terminal processing protease CtpA/Prc